MASIHLTIAVLFLVAISPHLCHAGYSHWPNFSCHTYNSSRRQQDTFNYNRMGWRSCLEAYQKFKGNCAEICVLSDDDILLLKVAGGPVIFDVDAFIQFFAAEMGYNMKTSGGPSQELMSKIRSKMEGCKKTNPEYEGLTELRNTKCEPWKKFLQCFNQAIGCTTDV